MPQVQPPGKGLLVCYFVRTGAGQALGRHMDVDVIAFTGSTEVGKYFLRYSGESNMKQVWLECGDKSPNIVLAYAPNLYIAARRTAFGIWFNQGEVCTAGSRLIVEDKIKDSFLEKVMAIGQKMMPGDPLDPKTQMGAMVDEIQTKRVMGYIDAGNKEMVWGVTDVPSWYRNRRGRIAQNWPFGLLDYWERTRHPDLTDYELT